MSQPRTSRALIAGLIFWGAVLSFGQENKGNQDQYQVKAVEVDTAPKIDGILENPLWENGALIEAFTQFEPQEGAPPSEKTTAYIIYDQNNLYIALRCYDSDPKAIRAGLTQRDKVMGDDEITIYLDTFNDKKRAFAFQANPRGIQSDGVFTEGGRRGGGGRGPGGGGMGFERIDKNWDTFFLAHARIDDEGYTVEFAIPFKSLRFPNTPSQTWGLKIMRTIRRKNEEIYWPPNSRSINGFLIQAGTIEIPGPIEKGKNIEVMPVVTGLKKTGEKFDPEAGMNLKWGITSDMTADMTYNPDYSQIEADMPQIDVNQRYALYYPEKRPFFLEGKDVFDTPLELVYTRKIADPKWGVKLTGKVKGTTLGFLSIIDEKPAAIEIPGVSTPENGPSARAIVNVFRLKKDIFQESHIGVIVTDKEMGSSYDSLFQNYSRVAGVDGHFKFWNYYRFSFQVLGSQSKANGEKTDIVPAATFNLSHNSRHWTISADWTSLPPDFEAATGFFRRKDVHALHSRVGYAFLPQTEWVVSVRPSFSYRRIYDFDKTLTDEEYEASLFISGWRQSHVWANVQTGLERYNGVDFRLQEFRANFSSEPFSWLSGNFNFSFGNGIYYAENPYLGYKTSRSARATLKPWASLRVFYNLQNNRFFKSRGGEKVYDINIISQRISYQISKSISLRLVADYNDYYKKIFASFLFSYEYRPGTVFYIGIDDSREKGDAGIFRSQGRHYFIKFSYWWRI